MSQESANPEDAYSAQRAEMVRQQLQARGVRDRRVLEAMARVPREKFVPPDEADQAYSDRALPIECAQTISQPLIVAMMTEALELSGTEHVLEIGTGSGYQAAVLGELARDVVSVERHPELSRQAGERLADAGYENVQLVIGDGTQGYAPAAPYDRIIVTAAAGHVPEELWQQLAEGGLLIIPLGDADSQVLQKIRKRDGRADATPLTGCRFVPLVGAQE